VAIRAKDPDVDAYLQKQFWKHPRNRYALTTAKAQQRLHRQVKLDGELALLLYVSTLTGQVTVRCINPRQIQQVLYGAIRPDACGVQGQARQR
jgi:hypothetical protein